ncbi:DUF5076 domain-containing protein [Janthinobacterium sp.]|uniref:DUF5076 domain-containing protein n=1 Tax=Janthinobacterium sp. TaxID=1871054 RepID=UPI00293D376F|nr:DUF5076 domain-containing protein [Janthinobacterium sp.]
MNERPIPESALRDTESVEMLRVWIAERQLHCSLKVGMYRDGMGIEEETAWGTILADTVRHIAKALHPDNVEDEKNALAKIYDKINLELMNPTSEARGKFV